MSRKLRELFAKLEGIQNQVKEHMKTLDTKSEEFDKDAYDAKLAEFGTEIEDVKREIETEKLLQVPSGHVEKLNPSGEEQTNVFATEEYRKAYFQHLQGKLTVEDLEQKFATSLNNTAPIPETTLNEIIKKLEQRSAMLNIVSVKQITGTLKLAVEKTISAAQIKAEGVDTDFSDTDITEELTWQLYEVTKGISVSRVLLDNSVSALEEFVVDSIAKKLAVKIESLLVIGTGTNEPLGILVDTRITNEPAGISAINYANLIKIIAALPTEYHRPRS
jgi:HK97 family phage major capsid protein